MGQADENCERRRGSLKTTLIPYLASPYSLKKSRGSTFEEFLLLPMLVNSTPVKKFNEFTVGMGW